MTLRSTDGNGNGLIRQLFIALLSALVSGCVVYAYTANSSVVRQTVVLTQMAADLKNHESKLSDLTIHTDQADTRLDEKINSVDTRVNNRVDKVAIVLDRLTEQNTALIGLIKAQQQVK